jgi:hypothetical protein
VAETAWPASSDTAATAASKITAGENVEFAQDALRDRTDARNHADLSRRKPCGFTAWRNNGEAVRLLCTCSDLGHQLARRTTNANR